MSNVAMMAELMLGGFAFFVEEGTTVDAQTVSETIKPDVVPTDNWPSLGSIQNFKLDAETQSDPYMKPLATGGFRRQEREWVIADFLDFQTREMNELVHRLQFGLASKIVPGTAQSPHVAVDRYIRGWLRLQGRQLGGTDRFILDWWCELRLNEKPNFDGPKVTSPALRAYKLEAAGNSNVFPA